MEQLGLVFDTDAWERVDDGDVGGGGEDDDELTLRSLLQKSAATQPSGGGAGGANNAADGAASSGDNEHAAAHDALLFLVDFRQSMASSGVAAPGADAAAAAPTETISPLSAALRCAAEVLKDKIIARGRDVVGVVACGTRATDNPNRFAHISVLRELLPPDGAAIVELERLAADPKYVREKYGHLADGSEADATQTPQTLDDGDGDDGGEGERRGRAKFHHALWTCRTLFARSKLASAAGTRRRVFVFTDDDDPSGGDAAQRTQAAVQARDLADAGAYIELIALAGAAGTDAPPPKGFRLERFWADVVFQDDEERAGHAMLLPASSFADARQRVRRREHARRALLSTTLSLCAEAHDGDVDDGGAAPRLGLQLFALRRRATRSSTLTLEARNNQPTRVLTAVWDAESAQALTPSQLRLSFGYTGSASAHFRPEELAELKRSVWSPPPADTEESGAPPPRSPWPPGLRLIGFVPLHCGATRAELHLLPALFARPDERSIRGSEALFAALTDAMRARRRAALVYAGMRAGAVPRFAVLIPQAESPPPPRAPPQAEGAAAAAAMASATERDSSSSAEGWHVLWLPYADDVREDALRAVAEHSQRIDDDDEDKSSAADAAAGALVRALSDEDFECEKYYNPDLQRYYAGLQSLALGGGDLVDVVDSLQPDERAMHAAAGEAIERLRAMSLDGAGGASAAPARAGERKRAKGTDDDDDNDDELVLRQREADDAAKSAQAQLDGLELPWAEYAERRSLSSLPVATLRLYCTAVGLGKSGRKDELVKRVQRHVLATAAAEG